MRRRTLLLWGLSGICSLTLACSEDESGPTAPAATQPAAMLEAPALSLYGLGAGPGCRTAPYRQFDFWLGSWEVAANGNPPRSASFITEDLSGCAIIENWHSPSSTARSLSAYDASDGQWHQHYVETSGFFPLRLDGGIRSGAMVMQGSFPDPFGTPQVFTDRYTWTALGPDDVRQTQERSLDGGQTFGPILFDGHYHRNPAPTVPTSRYYGTCEGEDPSLVLFHEFDFVVGAWEVRVDGPGAANGAAHRPSLLSDITHEMDGCLLEERITGPAGYEARVFLEIRPLDEIWQRTYMDNRGLRIFVTGPRMQNGKTVLTGTMPGPGHSVGPVRATFEQLDSNHFTERWERGGQGGTWTPLLTATYGRR
jgi:hypothetical protein